jgi:hypothetical protein
LDRTAELLFGSAAAILWRERLLPSLLGRPIAGWVALAGLALVLAQAGTPQRASYLAAAVLATLLVVGLLTDGRAGSVSDRSWPGFAGRAGGALSAALSSPPLRFTGRVSYGIYLYHLPIYYLVLGYAPGRSRYFYAVTSTARSCSPRVSSRPPAPGNSSSLRSSTASRQEGGSSPASAAGRNRINRVRRSDITSAEPALAHTLSPASTKEFECPNE